MGWRIPVNPASRAQIEAWFQRGRAEGATHMIVVCDTFDYEDFPVYVTPDQKVREEVEKLEGQSMQKIMEVYNLSLDMEAQLAAARVSHL